MTPTSLKFQASLRILNEIEFDDGKLIQLLENRQLFWDLSSVLLLLRSGIESDFKSSSLSQIFYSNDREENIRSMCKFSRFSPRSGRFHPLLTLHQIIYSISQGNELCRQNIDVGILLEQCVRFDCLDEVITIWNSLDEGEQAYVTHRGGPTRSIALSIIEHNTTKVINEIDYRILMGAFQENLSPRLLHACCSSNLQLTFDYMFGKKKNGSIKTTNLVPATPLLSQIELESPQLCRNVVKLFPVENLISWLKSNRNHSKSAAGLWIELWPKLSVQIKTRFGESFSNGHATHVVRYICRSFRNGEPTEACNACLMELLNAESPKFNLLSVLLADSANLGCHELFSQLSYRYPWKILEGWKQIERSLISKFSFNTSNTLLTYSSIKRGETYPFTSNSENSEGPNPLLSIRIQEFLTENIPKLRELTVTPNDLQVITNTVSNADCKREFLVELFDSASESRCHFSVFSWLWCNIDASLRQRISSAFRKYVHDPLLSSEIEFHLWSYKVLHVVLTQKNENFRKILVQSKTLQSLSLQRLTMLHPNVACCIWKNVLSRKTKNRLIQDFGSLCKSMRLFDLFEWVESIEAFVSSIQTISHCFFGCERLKQAFWKQFFSCDILSDFAVSFQGHLGDIGCDMESLWDCCPNFDLFKWGIDGIATYSLSASVVDPDEPWCGARADRVALCSHLLAITCENSLEELPHFTDRVIAELGWSKLNSFLATPEGKEYVELFEGKRRFSFPGSQSIRSMSSVLSSHLLI